MKRTHRTFLFVVLSIFATACHTETATTPGQAVATFAGGCFWCLEQPFDKLEGVTSTTSGYIGGDIENPTYKQVSRGNTGHTEAVQVVYDPKLISYAELLYVFWRNIDPTNDKGQFCDRGSQYRSEIFYHNEEQRVLASKSKAALEAMRPFKGMVATKVTPATAFYPAEDYHQDYYKKNPVRYKLYRYGCGRDKRLKELWGNSEQLSDSY
jgi:peptide-methionine (S)-S-oxide reductase